MTMRELLSKIDTVISSLSEIKEIQQITDPFPTPLQLPAVFLQPLETEKIREGNEPFRYIHTVRLIVIVRYATTQEGSLTDSTKGLLKIMEDIENVLENNMLTSSGVPLLYDVEIYPEDYSFSELKTVDNVYCRAGSLIYKAQDKFHIKAVS